MLRRIHPPVYARGFIFYPAERIHAHIPGLRRHGTVLMEKTWDGLPVSREKPYGATVVVYRRVGDRYLYLILHRKHEGPDYEGDWAWGPPAGCRLPGEPIDDCACRELWEETGLRLPLSDAGYGSEDWRVYMAEAPAGAIVTLSPEHDRYLWLPAEEAAARCLPPLVADQIRHVARRLEAAAPA